MDDQDTTLHSERDQALLRHHDSVSVLETCRQMISSQTPNLLRLYLNPWVAQVCLCLEYLAMPLLRYPYDACERCPSFLCNSREEAISGAIKLCRHLQLSQPNRRQSTSATESNEQICIVIDDKGTLIDFEETKLSDGSRIEFLPHIIRCTSDHAAKVLQNHPTTGCVVIASQSAEACPLNLSHRRDILTVRCVTAQEIGCLITDHRSQPIDVIVFDETFVNGGIPFAAFTTCQSRYAPWMKRSMSMFHSTTFQPATLPAMHFMKCMRQRSPSTLTAISEQLSAVIINTAARHRVYQTLYSPTLSNVIATTGFDRADPAASGHFVRVGRRSVLDGVAGVACSVRGHNPACYPDEIEAHTRDIASLREELHTELSLVCHLSGFIQATSGASAVEHALRLALTCHPERPYVLALEGGFGGKTLLALTGTSKAFYRDKTGPLYPHVIRVDPRSKTVLSDLDRAFTDYPIGLVQLELIQGVGGVREIPTSILEHLTDLRARHDCLLFVDEIQTGMYRTGPFLRSHDQHIFPDIVTIGKGACDMMFPMAGVLVGDVITEKLDAVGSNLARRSSHRYGTAIGIATLLNTLRQARHERWEQRVREQAKVFAKRLKQGLQNCQNVQDVRVFGMLIGIELNTQGRIDRRFGGTLAKLWSLAMLNHPTQPLLIGFCQYEPHVLKLTPGLMMSDNEIEKVCNTIIETLHRSRLSVLGEGLKSVLRRAIRGNGIPAVPFTSQ